MPPLERGFQVRLHRHYPLSLTAGPFCSPGVAMVRLARNSTGGTRRACRAPNSTYCPPTPTAILPTLSRTDTLAKSRSPCSYDGLEIPGGSMFGFHGDDGDTDICTGYRLLSQRLAEY
ncbi:hypothetical protein C8Q73DRAFT_687038 [Cubamyces lactineus]|nr:hypothetical protein C8Q73DRAFT_687038 [Cubamyces lactineus]